MASEPIPYSADGGPEGDTAVVNVEQTSGTILLEYETFFVPDRIQLRYEGDTIYDSGFVGTQGVVEEEIEFDGDAEEVTAVLTANLDDPGTLWFYNVDVEDEAFIVFREKDDGEKDGTWGGDGDLVPGWDHVGLSFNNNVYESHPGNGSGTFWDPAQEEFVSINNVNGVQQEHSLGSFVWDSQSQTESPVIRSEQLEIDSELGQQMVDIIEPLIGSAGFQLIADVSDFNLDVINETLSPSAQKGGDGTYTCVGLIEWAAEQAGQGFIPNNLETFTVSVPIGPVVEIPLLSPELLSYSLGISNQINSVKDWFQGFFDPVDFIITDPLGRRLGHTEDLGTVNEISGAFYTGDGSLEQFAIPEPIPGDYTLELVGLEDDAIAAVGGTNVEGSLFNGFLGEGETQVTTITVPDNGTGGFTDLMVSHNNFPEDIELGETFTYELVVTNSGSNQATNVVIAEQLPSTFDIISSDTSLARQFDDSLVGNIGTLEIGETKTLSITVQASGAGNVANVATITSDQADPDITNNISTIENEISPVAIEDADLELTKTISNPNPEVGEEVTFSLNLTNNGPGIASRIEITDLLPSGLTFVSASSNQGSYDPDTGIWDVGNIRDGINTSLNIVARVDVADNFTNTAEITSVDQADPDSTPNNNVLDEDDQSEVAFATQGTVTGSNNATNGDDLLVGTDNNDDIFALLGNDTVNGENGDDFLEGNGGDDIIDGGDGNDTLSGGNGNDLIDGGARDDILNGNNGNDTLIGGNGKDSLDGGVGNDSLDGGASDDQLLGQDGDDTLLGENGKDTLDGGIGNDSLDGGASDDQLLGQDGDDTLLGNAGRDTLSGGIGNDSLDGGSSNDQLLGQDGDDTLLGGVGSDTLDGGIGRDIVTGGSSPDTFVISSEAGTDTITDFGTGNDVIGLSGGLTFADLSFAGNDIIFSDETLATLNGFDTTTLSEGQFVTI